MPPVGRCPVARTGQAQLQLLPCPAREVPLPQLSFSRLGWSFPPITPLPAKHLFPFLPSFCSHLLMFLLCFIFTCFPFNINIFNLNFTSAPSCGLAATRGPPPPAPAVSSPPSSSTWGRIPGLRELQVPHLLDAGWRQGSPPRHAVEQPLVPVIVSLLTRVHKLSVNLLLSSGFSGARAKCWADRWGPEAFNRFFHFRWLV